MGSIILGKSTKPNANYSQNENIIINETQFRMGTALFGVQGMGKSGLIEACVNQNIRNNEAVFVFDPHKDLINDIIKQLPPERVKDTYLLELDDKEFPFGINFLDGSRVSDIDEAVGWAMSVFLKVFPGEGEQRLLRKVLRAVAYTLLYTPGSTIADIPLLLKDDAVRARFVHHVLNHRVVEHWQEYDVMSPAKRAIETQALNNRLPELLMNPTLENILAQKTSTIDFRKSIDNREIILIHLSTEHHETAQLIGTVLLAELYRAAFSFSNTDEAMRPGFSVYIDEWQEFVSGDIGRMFTNLRKFGCKLFVATQFKDKIKGDNYEAMMTANTIISLRATQKDARDLSTLFLDRSKKPAFIRPYWDVLKHLHKHHDELIYTFNEQHVKDAMPNVV